MQDHFLTPTARYADIVLPATTFWERNDVHTPWAGAGHYAIFMKQAIEPMDECRNDMDIFADLAGRVGIEGYNDKSEMAWLRELTEDAVDDFEAFAENGVARFAAPEDAVAFAREIRDPENHKFTTPSGKIEIYSMALAANPDPYGLGAMPPIPTWVPPFRRRHVLSAQAADAEVAGADALDPQQPAACSAASTATTSGCTRRTPARAASPTATSCACSTIAALSCCRRA